MIKKEDVKSKFAGEHHNCYTKGIWNWPEEHILGWISEKVSLITLAHKWKT